MLMLARTLAMLLCMHSAWAESAPPTLSALSGERQWAGQPSVAPASASNVTQGFLLADYFPPRSQGASSIEAVRRSTVTLTGSNLGDGGTVKLSNPDLYVREIKSWSPTAIRFVLATRKPDFSYDAKVSFTVVRSSDGASSAALRDAKGVAGMIATRTWGQCTWEVARLRLAAGLSVPDPLAYSGKPISAAWVPARWDAITFPVKPGSHIGHVAIISSAPRVSETKIGADWVRSYDFNLTDRNAGWSEAVSLTSVSFQLLLDHQAGAPIAIYQSFKRAYPAYAYFR